MKSPKLPLDLDFFNPVVYSPIQTSDGRLSREVQGNQAIPSNNDSGNVPDAHTEAAPNKYSVAAWPEFDNDKTVRVESRENNSQGSFERWWTDRPMNIELADFHDTVKFVTVGGKDRRPLLMFNAKRLQASNTWKLEDINTQIDEKRNEIETERAKRIQLEDGLGDVENLQSDYHPSVEHGPQVADEVEQRQSLETTNEKIMKLALTLRGLYKDRQNIERDLEVAQQEHKVAAEAALTMMEDAMVQAKCLPVLEESSGTQSNVLQARAENPEHAKESRLLGDEQQESQHEHPYNDLGDTVLDRQDLIQMVKARKQEVDGAHFVLAVQKARYSEALEQWKLDNGVAELLLPPVFPEDSKLGPEERLEAAFGRVWFETCRAATQNVTQAEKEWEVAKKRAEDAGIDLDPEAALPDMFGYSASKFDPLHGLVNAPLKRKRLEEWRPVGSRREDSNIDKPPSPDRSQASIESIPTSFSRHMGQYNSKRQKIDSYNKRYERDL
ncbi:hypothetical protein K491DRAFT_685249 [Lophiostoma macrostomum CBS 122681]|uniref:Uncharacterized protein n=1 Tax=Lophiostoma macrostomum CBS 122681 TaxID=1314788 RepID=A0A6A6SN53_9PLEO|nr:hypothetical protein K491DRAFT_685249 [Lophiostoma macrostomum CBS 122681]